MHEWKTKRVSRPMLHTGPHPVNDELEQLEIDGWEIFSVTALRQDLCYVIVARRERKEPTK